MTEIRTAAAASLLAVLGLAQAAQAQEFQLNVNTALAQSDPLYKGLESFETNLEEKSDGRIEVTLYPNSQLGSNEDVLEQARAGAPVAIVTDGGRLAVFTPEFAILGAPFLADGYEGIRKVVTSDLFEEWGQDLHDSAGLQVLSFNWWQGQRNLLTNVEVTTPEDLAGVRMRTPGAPVWTETIRAMGATPTPLPWGEVYSAIQQNAIDAAEAQLPAVVGAKLEEVIDTVTLTGHINLITGLVTSAQWFDSLPEDLQTLVRDEALAAGEIASQGTQDVLEQIKSDLREAGVAVNEIDKTPFIEATQPVYETLDLADLHAEVQAILDAE
ncbi:C4-dicarboxylate TRAP transporter substrate-binding protein [Allosediminivita pacifica]|uniref:Tripartite ATP-independent transporter DctP family solute receptor n=1 Tax=Allosediminivita pacifica TaxID=1267769 RepID=A0A2T6B0T8_9RHOB|nr:C4-dicarboxylate TRAP transporter substrate-binding protein [Allosediminivita pacifica]PTX49688.1 tripartite ATP-independent transporter DctP family solute receptor [Allosediminivita pacifica]GGB03821.1 C4-dicarboxylate ABC transporter [Allosediminivita pacifica]